MKINEIIEEIIPPSDYQHRNGFNNIPLINKLNEEDKKQLEDALINKLSIQLNQEVDTLVVETLAYLKSQKSIKVLIKLLETLNDDLTKLAISASIFEINKDPRMIDVALNIIKIIDNKNDSYYVYKLTSAFYYLIKFKSNKTIKVLEEYTNHNEFLVAYNARQVLSL
ncbi:MAG: hypothetical protein MH472_14405 [Bacteroidia bacterium]|nr:hypothetical protein [Bacteroidia bacterium]